MPPTNDLERIYNTLDETQWWPFEQIQALQRRELTPLINHARRTSDFYKDRLKILFRPNGTIDWDRWTDIPIVSRADLSEKRHEIQSKEPVQSHRPFSLVKSSGSTGDPVEFLTTRFSNDLSVAALWRGQKWAGMDWSQNIVTVRGDSKNLQAGDVLGPWGPYWMKDALKGKAIFTSYRTTAKTRADMIRANSAAYVTASAGLSAALVDHLRTSGERLELHKVRFIGGTANSFLRQEFKRLANADVLELYSSKEVGPMACPCPLGHGWHQNAEIVLLEIVDLAGKPVAPGEMGRVIVTPFGSTATPLIRYDQGDYAVAGPNEPCPCGRHLPRIASISGRVRHSMFKPDSQLILNLPIEARVALSAGTWQIAKVGEHSYEVRYKHRDWGAAQDLNAFQKYFHETFYPEAILYLKEVDDFVYGPTGKHQEVVDEWDPASQIGG